MEIREQLQNPSHQPSQLKGGQIANYLKFQQKVCAAEHLVFRASVERRAMVGGCRKGFHGIAASHTFILSHWNLLWYDMMIWYAAYCSCAYFLAKAMTMILSGPALMESDSKSNYEMRRALAQSLCLQKFS